jgi:CubicO group peptidase (beta-lactamase class C family)
LKTLFTIAAICLAAPLAAQADAPTDAQKSAFAAIDPLFETLQRESHIPGLIYGVVADGKLAYVRALGVQDTKTNAPVTPDTVFRIASMSKNFTALAALKLRDEGKLSFDAPAERYIPELKRLKYPTTDSPKITVRDLITHTAGFVTDDPWADRQLAMSEADFSQFLATGVPFARVPGSGYGYSNLGYALVGRLVTTASRRSYRGYVADSFLKPLGMTSTGYDLAQVPPDRRAIGYRWENGTWSEEPALGPGVFGAMGGITTTATDYARFIAWELAAWPPRDGPEDRILKRATLREMARSQTYAIVIPPAEPGGCGRAVSYSAGIIPASDCILGAFLYHAGGLPGYGSHVLMLPERGIGIFAFANLTYGMAPRVVRDAAASLVKSGAFPRRLTPSDSTLEAMATTAAKIYAAGDVLVARDVLAMNVLLDRDATVRNSQIVAMRGKLGECGPANPIVPDNAMSATVTYSCERGTLRVRLVLAPLVVPSLQTLEFQAVDSSSR